MLNPVGCVHSVIVYVYSQCMLQGNILPFKGFLQHVLSFRAHWSVLKHGKIRATSTSRPASMKTPSNVTQRPSLCVPMSRRRTYQRFIRTEQLHLNSRLATNSLRDLSNQTYDFWGMKTLMCASLSPEPVSWYLNNVWYLFSSYHRDYKAEWVHRQQSFISSFRLVHTITIV